MTGLLMSVYVVMHGLVNKLTECRTDNLLDYLIMVGRVQKSENIVQVKLG